MTFLNPAVLFGLIAAAIPVLLHLLNLRKLKTIEFSTLTFLKELQKNQIRKIKLRQWILLALRIMIIIFLVTAFSRPALRGISIGGTTSAAKTTAVMIIDDTFSMSAVGERGSQFNRAKQLAGNVLNELQEGDEVAILKLSEASSADAAPVRSIPAARKMISDISLSYVSGTLHDAIVRASAILAASRNFNKEIYIFSDFQKSRFSRTGETYSDFSQVLNDKVKLYTFSLSKQSVYNVGIDSLSINSQIFEPGKPVSFSCTVRNYSDRSLNNYVVSLFINGTRSAQNSIAIPPGESRHVVFETILKSTGLSEIFAEIEDDDVLQDNRKYLSIEIPEKTSTAVFSADAADAQYIELALAAGGTGFNVTSRNINQINSYDLSTFSSVILIGGAEISQYSQKISAYIQSGGGVIIMPSGNSTFSGFQAALSGLSLPLPVSTSGVLNSAGSRVMFDNVDYAHPVFEGLFEKNAQKQFESPDVYYYYKILPQGKGKNIISLIDNSSFLSEYSVGQGRVLLFASAPSLSWSNLPLKAVFAPLVFRSAAYLSFRAGSVNSYTAGSSAGINLHNRSLPQIKIVRPDNSSELVNLKDNTAGYVSYANTAAAGNYKVYSGERLVDYFSVNTDPQESDMHYMSAEEFDSYLKKIIFKGKHFSFDADENYMQQIRQARFGSELWRIFLILAFVCALAEMIISRTGKNELNT
ncbi:MAG: BatA domain-containing protein [Bacteroidota bacterium]